MSATLLQVYGWLMKTADLVVTEDHLISGKLGKTTPPVLIKGKRLVLPTPAHQAADKTHIVLFHPLTESITRGESDVLEKYRSLLMLRFNIVAAQLMTELLSIAISTDSHANLSPDQSEFLSKVKTADEKTYELIKKVLAAMPSDQTAKRIVTFFLKKTGSVAGKRHKRVGVVSFPLYQELKKEGHDIWGIKCRVKDKETLCSLLEFMFPQIDIEGSYNRGSDSDVAPNLDALMQASLAVIAPLNDITSTFENQLGDDEHPASELYIDCEWQDTFVNLGVMLNEIRRIPMQAGNEGSSGEMNNVAVDLNVPLPSSYPQAKSAIAPLHVPAAETLHIATPVATTVAPSTVAGNRQPLDGFLAEREANRQREQQSQQSWMAATHQRPVVPVTQAHQPVYQSHQPTHFTAAAHQPAAPTIVHTGRGLDFGSILQSNPGVAYATGGYPMQQQGPATQGSRWAQQAGNPGQSTYPNQQGPGVHFASNGHQRLA